ncbi:MAG: HK97 gp10 family phage protein [Clostridiales bacterium]|nr:HK97 gp10 family phage protein [Clostridiales bacterium]
MAKGMISVTTTGSFKNIEGFFKKTKRKNFRKHLEYYGELGVRLLASETPVDTGDAASSWSYEIEDKNGVISIYWKNSAMAGDIPVVLLVKYGHATGNGGYVEPNDFISPVMNLLFQDIADKIWKEVTSA